MITAVLFMIMTAAASAPFVEPRVLTSRHGELNVTLALAHSLVSVGSGLSFMTRTYNNSVPGALK